MGKRFEISEKYFRVRRGKLVEIPKKWAGKITCKQTIRKRQSKETRKQRNLIKMPYNREIGNDKYMQYKRGEDVFGELDNYEQDT